MARRLQRLEISELESLTQKNVELHFVLKSGAVVFAKLISVQPDFLKVKNTRGDLQSLHLQQLEEIWADRPA